MKRHGLYLLCALCACVIFLEGCSSRGLGGQIDACHLVTKTDAESILKKTVRFDREQTAEAVRLVNEPEVTGTCVYTSGDQPTSPRLVASYRVYDNPGIARAGFQDAWEKMWKDETKEVVEGAGDEAFLVGGHMMVLRKGKTWLQIGIMQSPPGEISVEDLKSVARRAGASL
jgi:hypothetical protein